jgi:hypothetical protein
VNRIPFRNFLSRRTVIPADLAGALYELERLVRERPEYARPGRTLAAVLRAAFGTAPEVAIPAMSEGAVHRAWFEGQPWFRLELPALDRGALRSRGLAICEALQAEIPSAIPLRSSIRRGTADLAAWTQEALAGRPEEIARHAHLLGLDSGLAASVLRLALLPALMQWSAPLDTLRGRQDWPRGDCPHCGSRPLLAEARGLEQAHFLRCGLCAADWPTRRLSCPHCGGSALSISFVEGEEARQRLSRCAACGDHLKIVSTLAPLPAPSLLVADLATTHLDLISGE